MGTDRHLGRNHPTAVVHGHPDRFIQLIRNHGVLARVMRARKCPCTTHTGAPNIFCKLCCGDGYIYDFQRKMLQTDEDSDIFGDRSTVFPFRTPILEPVNVERLLSPEQGGIKRYTIESFDSRSIKIAGTPLPYHFHKLRVSYYFDRYNSVIEDQVEVYPNEKVLCTTLTKYNGKHVFSNTENVHGDITLVTKIFDRVTGHEYKNYTFRKNKIQLADSEPTPNINQTSANYFYAPPTQVLPGDVVSTQDLEQWTNALTSASVNMSLEPWYEMSIGDMITLLSVEFFRNDILTHSSMGFDRLNEFDISKIDDEIFDEDGNKYRNGIDFYLRPFRDIVWIKNQPNAGKKVSVRFGYHPTYTIFMNNPVPNHMENKRFPKTFTAKYFTMALPNDVRMSANPEYAPETSLPDPLLPGMSEL